MLPSNRMAAILNQAWLQSKVKKVSPKYYSAYGMVWYGMVWYGMVWYGMVWHDMVRYGMV